MEKPVVKASDNLKILDFGHDAAKEEMSVSQFMDRLDVFKFNDPIQRNAVWNIQKKSLLIVSILQNVYIGQIMVQIIKKNKQKYRNVLDGKQRLTTIRDYIKGKFALDTKGEYVPGIDENENEILIDVSGLHFHELPKSFQDKIMALVLEFKTYEIDDNLKTTLFYRWNNGEALKPAEKRKAKMSVELLKEVADLKTSPVFQSGFKENDLNRDANGEAVLQSMLVIQTNNDTALNSSAIDEAVNNNVFNEEVVIKTKEAVGLLEHVHNSMDEEARKKTFTKAKVVSLMYAAAFAIEKNIDKDVFAEWVNQFFNVDYDKTGFAVYAGRGTAKKANVKTRTDIMMKHLKEKLNLE